MSVSSRPLIFVPTPTPTTFGWLPYLRRAACIVLTTALWLDGPADFCVRGESRRPLFRLSCEPTRLIRRSCRLVRHGLKQSSRTGGHATEPRDGTEWLEGRPWTGLAP